MSKDMRIVVSTTANAICNRPQRAVPDYAKMNEHYASGGKFPIVTGGSWDVDAQGSPGDASWFMDDLRHFVAHGAWPHDSRNARYIVGKFGAESLSARRARWEAMWRDIRDNGYRVRPCNSRLDKYITVSVGRGGKLFFWNGEHRWCCIVLAGRGDEPLPVEIICRHELWESIRKRLINAATEDRKGWAYCAVPHPDLADVPSKWNAADRGEQILAQSLNDGGLVLDAGGRWGCVSYWLAQRGMKCLVVEHSKTEADIAKTIAGFHDAGFEVQEGNLMECERDAQTLLLLNLAHHFLKRKTKYNAFMQWLGRRSFAEIFYQGHGPRDSFLREVDLSPREYAGKIAEAARLSNVSEINMSESSLCRMDGRKIYHIT